ncbi:MAG: hypothetical protein KDD35_02120, partial [Bdellovibrionales bacterium]|nr:hypothetical protein [Bdellovibrionales bacterium]
SLIMPEDVVIAITRMARERPNFPVIKDIVGLSSWLNLDFPLESLPSGIEIEGHKISIKLTNAVGNPLFRFCLELFSIIPKKCIDLKNGAILCERIPVSGYYEIENETNKYIVFSSRAHSAIFGLKLPKRIMFSYSPLTTVLNDPTKLLKHHVVAAHEGMIKNSDIKRIASSLGIQKKPSSRFSVLVLNKKGRLFSNRILRLWFSEQFRKSFAKIESGRQIEASLFTKILPGYLSHAELIEPHKEALAKIKLEELNQLTNLNWAARPDLDRGLFEIPLENLFSSIGVQLPKPKKFSSRAELSQAFLNGEIDLMYGSTGFWSLDPIGDLQMLFTPNLHQDLRDIANDPEVRSRLQALSADDAGIEPFEELNRYLFDDAAFSVFTHHARIYLQSKTSGQKPLPFGITSPPPWMLFAVEDEQ